MNGCPFLERPAKSKGQGVLQEEFARPEEN
jgi:hypothetical protein